MRELIGRLGENMGRSWLENGWKKDITTSAQMREIKAYQTLKQYNKIRKKKDRESNKIMNKRDYWQHGVWIPWTNNEIIF